MLKMFSILFHPNVLFQIIFNESSKALIQISAKVDVQFGSDLSNSAIGQLLVPAM